MTIHAQKKRLRAEVRARRESLTPEARAAKSGRIFEHLQTLACWRQAKNVLVYVSVRAEVETAEILARLVAEKRCVVPWCRENGSLGLFRLTSPEDELLPGTLGIPEPAEAWREMPDRVVPPPSLDIILLPGVAFDRAGGRLGQGGGFYDRLLESLAPQAVTVGLAYTCQIVPEVPRETHDRRVDFVVTEEGIF